MSLPAPEFTIVRPPQPERPPLLVPGVLLMVGACIAFALVGADQSVTINGVEHFAWTEALLAFCPIFVAGAMFVAASQVIKELRDAKQPPTRR